MTVLLEQNLKSPTSLVEYDQFASPMAEAVASRPVLIGSGAVIFWDELPSPESVLPQHPTSAGLSQQKSLRSVMVDKFATKGGDDKWARTKVAREEVIFCRGEQP
jgi:hypothetical protein